MRIVYLTLDDVNRFMVRCWAAGDTFRVDCPAANAPVASVDGADAVILDLDHLPEPFRAAWLAPVPGGLTLDHGHNIADTDAAALRRRGMRVCRGRLRRGLVSVWAESVASAEAPASGECLQPESPSVSS